MWLLSSEALQDLVQPKTVNQNVFLAIVHGLVKMHRIMLYGPITGLWDIIGSEVYMYCRS